MTTAPVTADLEWRPAPALTLVPRRDETDDETPQRKRWYKAPLPPFTERNAEIRCRAITKSASWDSTHAGAVVTRAVAENA